MKIQIEKCENYFYADCLDLPGSPPCGVGDTPEMALACLFYLMIFDSTLGPDPSNWIKFIKQEEPIIINGDTWKHPPLMSKGRTVLEEYYKWKEEKSDD